jgi:acyl-coenzyme A synthetase/AMP-(fatty) acid ligase
MAALSLSANFEAACRRFDAALAFCDAGGAPASFRNFFFTVIAFAEELRDRGVRPGAMASVHVEDGIAGTALRLALLRLGATLALAPQSLGKEGAWHIHAKGTEPPAATGAIAFDAGWIRSPRQPVPIAGGARILRVTSGTTGLPKLRLMEEESALARILRGLRERGAPQGPTFIGYSPFSAPFFNHALRALLTGVPQLHTQATPEASLAAMDRFGATDAYVSPYNFARLLDAAEATAVRPRALARVTVGGGEVSPTQAIRGETLLGCEVRNSYGSNETGSIASHRPALTPDMRGIVGKIYSDLEFRFSDDTGRTCDPETGGEISIKVPAECRARDFPSSAFLGDAEGWVATGDIGRLLPGGELQLLGRKSEFLNVGGTKCAPAVFEAALGGFPGVSELVAFRAPALSGIDHVGLAVVAGEGFSLGRFRAFVQEKLGRLYPAEISVLARIPTNAAGKIDRGRLTSDYLALQSA